ncbi:MAG: carboxynorspermidine decarboxylase, partial [Selenomonas sp.]|nr:carboxynorspermidine decarboxylase [Selenomonas sp.]
TQDHDIYDPCAPGSRLGVTAEDFAGAVETAPQLWELLDGLHFHTLCEQNSDALAATLQAVGQKFGCWLEKDSIHWLNMGGGHHITRADYDRQLLIDLIKGVKDKYDVAVYLEPGEAVALNAGYLITEVLDTVTNHGVDILLLDASAACHMPDVLEMPYRPPLKDSGEAGEKAHTYRLSSCTCLAGDIIGDYSFDRPVKPGDRLYFEDMAIYSMVKNNTFNGMALPSIWKMDAGGECTLVRKFGYKDFKERLS